jgi:hypothetical protein
MTKGGSFLALPPAPPLLDEPEPNGDPALAAAAADDVGAPEPPEP